MANIHSQLKIMKSSKGAALILVLWTIAILSYISINVITSIRLENNQSNYILQQSKALIAAEGGIAIAVEKILDTKQPWIIDGLSHDIYLDNIKLVIKIGSERGKLDVNFCDLNLLEKLLKYFNVDHENAQKITSRVSHRRNMGYQFRSLDEVQQITQMNETVFNVIRPLITLWTGGGVPDPSFADKALIDSLDLNESMGSANSSSAISIQSNATLKNGFTKGLEVRLLLKPNEITMYQILDWQEQ